MKNNTRSSNFELMRIISMFFIVIWHTIFHGGFFYGVGGFSHVLLLFIVTIIVVHVNSFIIVSGYFQYDKKFKLKKFLNLFLLQWLYKVMIVIILYTTRLQHLSTMDLVKELLPFGTENYWFINCYLTLYILSPFLNKLIEALNQKEFRKLLIISFILFSIIPYITNDITISNTGFTIVNFVYLYLIGAYFHKYPIRENIHFKNYSINKRRTILLIGAITLGLLTFLLNIFAIFISGYDSKTLQTISSYILGDITHYSSPIVIMQSICYFLFFETLNIRNSIINKISLSTIAIYLIHDNYNIRKLIYNKPYIKEEYLHGIRLVVYIIILSLIIFICCLLIEKIRKLIAKTIEKNKQIKKLKLKFYKFIENF